MLAKTGAFISFLMALLPAASYGAVAGCYMPANNSCWEISNALPQSLTIRCVDDKGYLPGNVWVLAAGETKSIQFSPEWGDGLGFPEPGVGVDCQVLTQAEQQATLRFSSLDWGNFVRIRVKLTGLNVYAVSPYQESRQQSLDFPWLP